MNKLYLKFTLLLVFTLSAGTFVFSQRSISGKVQDATTSEPIIGAAVQVQNTTVGTITDADGNFSLIIPDGSQNLVITFTGYTTIIQSIGVSNNYLINLKPGLMLEEVILIGYGSQKKTDKTGAVSMVRADELNVGSLQDPVQALQGKAAGVTISKQGGDPNGGFSVNIRGASGFTSGTGPLFVVDGVPGVDPTTISPNDIESYNVLKDASSTAIYGARGSNGVIIITTKNAGLAKNKGRTSQIEYNGQVSVDQTARRLDFLTGDQIRDFAAKTGRTFIDNGANVDWLDEIYRTGLLHDQTLSFSSSDENSNYRASISHLNIDGLLLGSAKQRSIGRLNFTQKGLQDKLTVQARISVTVENNNYVNYGGGI